MHELAVCQALMGQLNTIAEREHAERILSLELRIGPLSGVVPELLSQAFPIASAGSLAAGAELNIRQLPVRVSCRDCGAEDTCSELHLGRGRNAFCLIDVVGHEVVLFVLPVCHLVCGDRSHGCGGGGTGVKLDTLVGTFSVVVTLPEFPRALERRAGPSIRITGRNVQCLVIRCIRHIVSPYPVIPYTCE